MKYCRFDSHDGPRYGLVELVGEVEAITALISPPLAERPAGAPPREMRALAQPIALDAADLLAPVEPSKIVCVGRNYRDHTAELNHPVPAEPMFFLKPPSSLLDPRGIILRPKAAQRVDFEGELALVIGRRCRNLGDSEDVRPYILGYTALNDVTARDLQTENAPWTRAKGFDTFCPVGPMVSSDLDPWAGVEVTTRVNGAVRQHGNTRDFIFPLDAIIRYISRVMTLVPGDLIATGTPAGVGPLAAGDLVEVIVEGVGTLRNTVMDE
jgi:2-keto-4-pentenoate hydratase/2-oxohepta-3-ene-1,7-dioic acid hydratase in catechol pathway